MRVYGASRRELFERLDQPALKPLPAEPIAYSEWRKARLNIDYHAEVEHHFYSAPHALVHEDDDAVGRADREVRRGRARRGSGRAW